MSVSVTVTGADDISSKFQRITQQAKQFQSRESKKVADDMVTKMQAKAPVRTGYLRDHITAQDDGLGKATVKSEADYSIFVEFGTRFMSAQPFFFSVVDEYSTSAIMDDFRTSVLTG